MAWSLSDDYEHISASAAGSPGSDSEHEGDGWVMVGSGQDVAPVHVDSIDSTPERVPTPAHSEILHVDTPTLGSVARSTTSSMTTISHPSPPPSIRINVSTHPPIPIDVGDEGKPGERGQEDREDGKVDDVFKLHSSRRMKPTSTGRGVSIPSREPPPGSLWERSLMWNVERRWCRYVNLLFQRKVPSSYLSSEPHRIKLKSITILLHPSSGWQKPLASLVVGSGKLSSFLSDSRS